MTKINVRVKQKLIRMEPGDNELNHTKGPYMLNS